jgi:hypothetical protein
MMEDRDVAIRLINPGGVVHLARDVKELFLPMLPQLHMPHAGGAVRCYAYVTADGMLRVAQYKTTVNTTMGLPLGVVRWRPKKRQVAFFGVFFQDFWDELVDAFAYAGLSVVYARKESGGGR